MVGNEDNEDDNEHAHGEDSLDSDNRDTNDITMDDSSPVDLNQTTL